MICLDCWKDHICTLDSGKRSLPFGLLVLSWAGSQKTYKMACSQQRIRSAHAGITVDSSVYFGLVANFQKPFHADSEYSYQHVQMFSLIWVFHWCKSNFISSPELKAQVELIVYQWSVVRPSASIVGHRSHFQTWITLKPAGQSWSNFMCCITGVGERLHKVLWQIGSKLWFPWQQKAPIDL